MTDQQLSTAAPQDYVPAVPAHDEQNALALYQSMLASVPDAQEGEGMERILAQLATAQTTDDLNAPWRKDDMESLVGITLTIVGIHKSPSDYQDGLGWFFIVDAFREDTGELIVATTGSSNILAQLTRAWAGNMFPVRATVTVADKPTKAGYFPQRLTFLPRDAQPADVTPSAS